MNLFVLNENSSIIISDKSAYLCKKKKERSSRNRKITKSIFTFCFLSDSPPPLPFLGIFWTTEVNISDSKVTQMEGAKKSRNNSTREAV